MSNISFELCGLSALIPLIDYKVQIETSENIIMLSLWRVLSKDKCTELFALKFKHAIIIIINNFYLYLE